MENNARIVAFRALERCEKDHAWSAVTLDSLLRETELPARDAALATRMFLGVLQNETYLDHYLDLFCRTRTEPALRAVLRLGAYQLLFLDKIPAHAAVSETVELCRSVRLDRGASLVNAVLRRLSENKDRLPPIPGEGSASFLAIRYSHPLWLAERLMREQGYHQIRQGGRIAVECGISRLASGVIQDVTRETMTDGVRTEIGFSPIICDGYKMTLL